MNKVILLGNIGKEIELKALQNGMKVANFSLATNRTYKKGDEKVKETEWHNIVAFGKTAETIARYCEKGQQLAIEGRIQTRSWDGQDGKKNYRTEIILSEFHFVSGGNTPKSPEQAPQTPKQAPHDPMGNAAAFDDDVNPSDVPF